MNRKEIHAMIELLDDPDSEVTGLVSQSLFEKGLEIVPELEKAWETIDNSTIQDKLEDIIHRIQLNFIQLSLSEWIRNGATDLLEGCYVLAKYQYPDLGFFEIANIIERVKEDAARELHENNTAHEKVNILNRILFEKHKFVSNVTNYYSPQNSYINQVLYSKKGNPISLGIIYIAIANKLGIPIYGVNLPKNFILAYVDEWSGMHSPVDDQRQILFYINPFNRGAVLSRKEIDEFLKKQDISAHEMFYVPCSNLDIIRRLLLNLIYSYEKLGYQSKINDLKKLIKLAKLPDDQINL